MAYEFETDEWRSAVRDMTPLQRIENCGHTGRTAAVCPDCGDDIRSER